MSSDNGDMARFGSRSIAAACGCLCVLVFSIAQAQEVSFVSTPLWLSVASTTEGQPVRISTVITKQNDIPVQGEVTFFAGHTKIGATDFSLASSESGKVITLSWTPAAGTYPITAQITRAQTESETALTVAKELRASQSLIVVPDNDRDTEPDDRDPDDDNDGVSDVQEKAQGSDPKKAEPIETPNVLGASTSVSTSTDVLDRVIATVHDIGDDTFVVTEDMRKAAQAYVNEKLARREAQQALDASLEFPRDSHASSTKFKPVVEARSFKEQLTDFTTIGNTILVYLLKAASFVTGNVYAFYLAAIAFILLLIRNVWKRYSLD